MGNRGHCPENFPLNIRMNVGVWYPEESSSFLSFELWCSGVGRSMAERGRSSTFSVENFPLPIEVTIVYYPEFHCTYSNVTF